MIERLWELLQELWEYLGANFDPFRDTIDILIKRLNGYKATRRLWPAQLLRYRQALHHPSLAATTQVLPAWSWGSSPVSRPAVL